MKLSCQRYLEKARIWSLPFDLLSAFAERVDPAQRSLVILDVERLRNKLWLIAQSLKYLDIAVNLEYQKLPNQQASSSTQQQWTRGKPEKLDEW